MNHRHSVRKRASLTDQERRTLQAYPAQHQTAYQTAAPSLQTSASADEWDDTDGDISPRSASIVRRYNRIPTPDGYIETRGNRQMYVHFVETPPPIARANHTTDIPEQQPRHIQKQPRSFHWLYWVGIVFLVMILGYVGLGAFGSWWQIHSDDSTYGRPRTFQMDAVVGHRDSEAHPSHFIALNLNRRIVAIELPGGDVSKAMIYTGPTLLGDGQDLTPVTLTFSDVNGDGRPDMLIHILDQTFVFLNSGAKFVPPSSLLVDGGGLLPHLGGEQ